MSSHLTPSQIVEALIGRPEVVGPMIGMTDKAGYRWRRSSATRDAGDMPSARVMRSLLAHAAAQGIPLKPEHLIWGAPAAEVEEILKSMAAAPQGGIEAAE